MYAIVDIIGQQFRVEQGRKIFVHRLQAEEGSTITLDKVLLTGQEDKVLVGTPYVDGAAVKATVLEHLKGDKVIVFKKKRRKGHQKKNGHRQCLTQIHIDEIV
jgi:large subunit ribosomal protein L21